MTSKKQVYIQLTVNKMGEVNTVKEAFDAELVIRSRWKDDGKGSWSPNLFIENIIGEPPVKTSVWKETDASGAAVNVEQKRLRGSFSKPMELQDFPFDIQELWFAIKADQPISETELLADETRPHKVHVKSFIDTQEFYLYKYVETSYPNRDRDPELPKQHRPSIKISCFAARRPKFFIWNVLFVMFLLVCMSFLSFTMDVEKLLNVRLQLMFTMVLGAIMFRNVVNAYIPKISYLTYVDKFILVSVVFIIVMAFWHGFSSQVAVEIRKQYDFYAACGFGGVYGFFLFVFSISAIAGSEAASAARDADNSTPMAV